MSAQINTHNVAEDAHANRFANYLPLSGGTITGELVIGNEREDGGSGENTISFSKAPNTLLIAKTDYYSGNVEKFIVTSNGEIDLQSQLGSINIQKDVTRLHSKKSIVLSAPKMLLDEFYT